MARLLDIALALLSVALVILLGALFPIWAAAFLALYAFLSFLVSRKLRLMMAAVLLLTFVVVVLLNLSGADCGGCGEGTEIDILGSLFILLIGAFLCVFIYALMSVLGRLK